MLVVFICKRSMSRYLPAFAFMSLGIIWGSNFIYMKWATTLITPLQVVLIRVIFGFIPVFIYAFWIKVLKLSHLKYSIHFFVMSLLGASVYFYFFVKATSLLSSGITGALSGSIPLFSFILAVLFLKEEKITLPRVLGILIGFNGVIILAEPWNANIFEANLEGVVSITLGSLVVGSSFVYAKKFITPLHIHFAALSTYQLGFAVLTLLLITPFEGISNVVNDTHVFLGLIMGLGLLGTGIAYIVYYYIIDELGAVSASSVTYIPPVIALAIGYFFVGEDIGIVDVFATLLIFAGVFLIKKK